MSSVRQFEFAAPVVVNTPPALLEINVECQRSRIDVEVMQIVGVAQLHEAVALRRVVWALKERARNIGELLLAAIRVGPASR